MPQIAHFSSREMKKLPSVGGGGGHPPPTPSLSKIVPPSIFLAHYATATGVYTGGGGAWGACPPPNKNKPWLIFNSIKVIYKYFLLIGMPQIAHFQVEKWKISWEGGVPHPPPARSLRSLGLGRFGPSQRLCPPKCFGSLRHWQW